MNTQIKKLFTSKEKSIELHRAGFEAKTEYFWILDTYRGDYFYHNRCKEIFTSVDERRNGAVRAYDYITLMGELKLRTHIPLGEIFVTGYDLYRFVDLLADSILGICKGNFTHRG